MDRAADGLRFDGDNVFDFDPARGPMTRAVAIGMLRRADELMAESEPDQALALYGRAATSPDRDVAAAGVYGMGNALYRLDRDDEALQAWQRVTDMPESVVTYRAWRQVAAAKVRMQDLPAALAAYRQCERRAPAQDRAEIHSRLGWLSKETGNTSAASKYFARSRGDALGVAMTYLIIAVTAVTSLIAQGGHSPLFSCVSGGPLELQLQLDKVAVANGEIYRLLSVVLVHDPGNIAHLLFNMYALWYAGQLVERMYGARLLVAFYVIAGIAASIASYAFGDAMFAVGASGAVFGLFGIVLVATRYHLAMLDSQARAVASQVGFLIVLNLVLGFSGALGSVDNLAHVGGLAAGVWLGLLIPPGHVPTMLSFWQQRRGGEPSRLQRLAPVTLGLAALAGVLVVGYLVGTSKWHDVPEPVCLPAAVAPVQAGNPATIATGYELEFR